MIRMLLSAVDGKHSPILTTSAYEEEMSFHAGNGSNMSTEERHDLDLNLGIAPPHNSNSSMGAGSFQLHCASNNLHENGIMDFASAAIEAHLSCANLNVREHPFIWSGVDSSYHPIYGGTTIEKSMGVKPLPPSSTTTSL